MASKNNVVKSYSPAEIARARHLNLVIKDGKNNKLRACDIKKIVDTVMNRTSELKFAKVVSREEIRENDYNLNIPRYVDTFEEEEEIPEEKTEKVTAEVNINLDSEYFKWKEREDSREDGKNGIKSGKKSLFGKIIK